MDVIVTRRYKGKIPSYNYAAGTGSAVAIPPPNVPPAPGMIPYPDPAVYNFQDTDNPIILNFDTLYAPVYGRNPRFTLLIYEDSLPEQESGFESENEITYYIAPKIIVVDDIITQVEYDLSGVGVVSGKIIINK